MRRFQCVDSTRFRTSSTSFASKPLDHELGGVVAVTASQFRISSASGVADAEIALVGLAVHEIRRRRLVNDRLRDAEVLAQAPRPAS